MSKSIISTHSEHSVSASRKSTSYLGLGPNSHRKTTEAQLRQRNILGPEEGPPRKKIKSPPVISPTGSSTSIYSAGSTSIDWGQLDCLTSYWRCLIGECKFSNNRDGVGDAGDEGDEDTIRFPHSARVIGENVPQSDRLPPARHL